MKSETYSVLVMIGECHRLLQCRADSLAVLKGIRSVSHWFDIRPLEGKGLRIEEFVDTEFSDGEAMSWCLEITATPASARIEADIRTIKREGQDVVWQIADELESLHKGAPRAVEIATQLCCADMSRFFETRG